MLTIAQPLRIGDQVTILDQTGVVEDVRLNYTLLRTAEGRRLLIPNERLASEMIRNDTILDERVRPEASVWLPPGADLEIAISGIASIEEGRVRFRSAYAARRAHPAAARHPPRTVRVPPPAALDQPRCHGSPVRRARRVARGRGVHATTCHIGSRRHEGAERLGTFEVGGRAKPGEDLVASVSSGAASVVAGLGV